MDTPILFIIPLSFYYHMPMSVTGLEELLQNDEFVRWVLQPDEAGNHSWESWLRQNPGKAEAFFKARELVQSLHGSEEEEARELREKKIATALWDRINEQIRSQGLTGRVIPMRTGRLHTQNPLPLSGQDEAGSLRRYEDDGRPEAGKSLEAAAGRLARETGYTNGREGAMEPGRRMLRGGGWARYMSAAALMALLAGGGYWLLHRTQGEAPGGKVVAGMPSVSVSKTSKSSLEWVNSGNLPQAINLVDGTRIILEGHSSLHYEKFLQKDKREVVLEGEAFFEVANDAKRPFYVHTRGLLTRVLGTSFRIIARKEDEKITVAVKTGKVAVSQDDPDITQAKVPEYILQANQEVVFNKRFQASGKSAVVDSTLTARPAMPYESFSFSDAPVATILQRLSDAYAVEIVYDREQFSKCQITVSLDALSFEEKLDLLCKVVGVHYRIEDYKIFIEGKGCQ